MVYGGVGIEAYGLSMGLSNRACNTNSDKNFPGVWANLISALNRKRRSQYQEAGPYQKVDLK